MAKRREDLHKLIDDVPEEKLPTVEKYLREMSMPEEEPTEEEKRIIEQALKEYKNGEYYTFNEVFGEDDDNV